MSTSNLQAEVNAGKTPPENAPVADRDYKFTFVETPSSFVSAYRQIRDWLREPKVTVPARYYRGEVKLPATDLRPWILDFPSQLKVAFEKPRDPIGIYNHEQQEKRALCALVLAMVLGAAGWWWRQDDGLLLGVIIGFALGELAGALIFKNRPYPPDIWRDYRLQAASWVNSALVHVIAVTLVLLPYLLTRMWQPVKAASKTQMTDISYIPLPPDASGKKMGGGGGGGEPLADAGIERRHPQICQDAARATHGGDPQPASRASGGANAAGAAGIEASANERQHALG